MIERCGPGTVTITYSAADVSGGKTLKTRGALLAGDRTLIVRTTPGATVDSLTAGKLNLTAVRSLIVGFQQNAVPVHPDGRYHMHCDPTNLGHLYSDAEFQRLNTSLPDYVMYRDFAVGELLGCVFFRNIESPLPTTVGAPGAVAGVAYQPDDPIGGELYTNGATTGKVIHRSMLTGMDVLHEYHMNLDALETEAGITGKTGNFTITNNGIQINADRIKLVLRAPLDRLQENVSISWKFQGAHVVPTDGVSGDAQRYKRVGIIESVDA